MSSSDKDMINKLITDRYSPVLFDPGAVGEEKVNMLFEAARWAPSSRNEQPWRFIYAHRNDDVFEDMLSTLFDENRIWAQNAPLLILSIAKTTFTYKGKPNYYAFHDTGMAVANLLIQATDMGLYVHQMGGYDKEKARDVLNIPEGYQPVAMIAVGYKGNPEEMPEELRKRDKAERKRKFRSELVYRGGWQS